MATPPAEVGRCGRAVMPSGGSSEGDATGGLPTPGTSASVQRWNGGLGNRPRGVVWQLAARSKNVAHTLCWEKERSRIEQNRWILAKNSRNSWGEASHAGTSGCDPSLHSPPLRNSPPRSPLIMGKHLRGSLLLQRRQGAGCGGEFTTRAPTMGRYAVRRFVGILTQRPVNLRTMVISPIVSGMRSEDQLLLLIFREFASGNMRRDIIPANHLNIQ
ncbi:hypothetical protein EDB80DRAFT_75818 [Ilyonectria destructans]|nr:hypothetical protein EDB80DRAFT_75818 [Ilyonectria destructans]